MIDHASHDSNLPDIVSAHNVMLAGIANVILTSFAAHMTI
jgi:hypothetical protein